MCNSRLIWGGNDSINNIRKFTLKERSLDIAFADRYSFCVIEADAVLRTEEQELIKLAEKFYNDTYLMDQNACVAVAVCATIVHAIRKPCANSPEQFF